MDTQGAYPRFPWPEFGHTSIGHPLPETLLSDNNRPNFRRSIDWAKLRAAAAQQQLNQMLGERRITWRKIASVAAAAVLLGVVSLWVWIYWGLPRVPDADALWALNRQESVMFVDREGEILGVRGPYYARRGYRHRDEAGNEPSDGAARARRLDRA
jgi:hypothetical protein